MNLEEKAVATTIIAIINKILQEEKEGKNAKSMVNG